MFAVLAFPNPTLGRCITSLCSLQFLFAFLGSCVRCKGIFRWNTSCGEGIREESSWRWPSCEARSCEVLSLLFPRSCVWESRYVHLCCRPTLVSETVCCACHCVIRRRPPKSLANLMPDAGVVAVQVPGLLSLAVSVPIVRMQFDACNY